MASDSRVTWVNPKTNLPLRWFDSPDFLKTITLDGVQYGFAGSNAMFKVFLIKYTTKEKSEFLLDTVVQAAKELNLHIYIMRYENPELKLFAYSRDEKNSSEILRIASDPLIDRKYFAIGSGKFSGEYKKNRLNNNAHQPIYRIINANRLGLKKAGMINLHNRTSSGVLTPEQSEQAHHACNKKGGDLYTGGEVKMTQSATKKQIQDQVAILDSMDKQAKAAGAICASPVYTSLEVQQLKSLGQYAISPNVIEQTAERAELLEEMQKILRDSV